MRAGHDLLGTSPTLGSIRVLRELDGLRRLLERHKAYGPVREYLVRFDNARRAECFCWPTSFRRHREAPV